MSVKANAGRLEKFCKAHAITVTALAASAGVSRQSLRHIRRGSDPYVKTIRAIVTAVRKITGQPIEARELFDVGEDLPGTGVTIHRMTVADHRRRSLKRYGTKLDRILRGEKIIPNDFAHHVGIARQSLLRLRNGQDEPCRSTLAQMVKVLRAMTGKSYRARHLYDLGEESTPID
jgi:predicted transcriptional regulator